MSGDLWPVLPAHVRAAGRVVAHDAWRTVFDGVPGFGVPWRPTRPLFMDPGHLDDLGRVTARLARLALEACQRRAGTAGELADVLGVPEAYLPLLDRAAPLDAGLLISIRPDVVYQAGVPKFVELNIEGGVGGTAQVDLIAPRFAAAYQRALAAAGPPEHNGIRLKAPPPTVAARFAAIRDSLDRGDTLRAVIPVFAVGTIPGLTDPARFISWLGPMCQASREHGFTTTAWPIDRMTLDRGGRLCADEGPVDLVIRLFLFSAQPPSAGTEAFAGAIRGGTAAMHTPEATCLLMDKRTLAWLWADLGVLDAADQELVRRHVPWTAHLPAGTPPDDPLIRRAATRRDGMVLKPAGGHGGTGVVIGPEVSGGRWRDALDEAAATGEYVLQEYAVPDLTEMDFVHAETGERCTAAVPFTVGPFLFGLRPSGVLVRHGAPGGNGVLNLNFGALPNTVLLAGEPF